MNYIKVLQEAIAASKNDKQRGTGLTHRAMFLVTEVGEVLREVLKLDGLYGRVDRTDVRGKLAGELCDVIWNACDLATQLGIDLGPHMAAMLETNKTRTWPETFKVGDLCRVVSAGNDNDLGPPYIGDVGIVKEVSKKFVVLIMLRPDGETTGQGAVDFERLTLETAPIWQYTKVVYDIAESARKLCG